MDEFSQMKYRLMTQLSTSNLIKTLLSYFSSCFNHSYPASSFPHFLSLCFPSFSIPSFLSKLALSIHYMLKPLLEINTKYIRRHRTGQVLLQVRDLVLRLNKFTHKMFQTECSGGQQRRSQGRKT